MLKWMALAVGGVFGVFARCIVSDVAHKQFGAGFPIGTLLVNITGCLLVGIFLSLAESKFPLGPHGQMMLITGFCGAYTTFSTLMMETSMMSSEGEVWLAFANLMLSVALGFVLFRVGLWIGKSI